MNINASIHGQNVHINHKLSHGKRMCICQHRFISSQLVILRAPCWSWYANTHLQKLRNKCKLATRAVLWAVQLVRSHRAPRPATNGIEHPPPPPVTPLQTDRGGPHSIPRTGPRVSQGRPCLLQSDAQIITQTLLGFAYMNMLKKHMV